MGEANKTSKYQPEVSCYGKVILALLLFREVKSMYVRSVCFFLFTWIYIMLLSYCCSALLKGNWQEFRSLKYPRSCALTYFVT